MELVVPGHVNKILISVCIILMVYSCRTNDKNKLTFFNVRIHPTQIINDTTCIDGRYLDGVLFQLYPNNDTLFVEHYKYGKLNGIKYAFGENKKLKSRGFYTDGKANGKYENWYDNGQCRFVYHFKNDEFDGELLEWYSNGKLFKKLHYKNGQEDGMQQLWYEDDKVRANYEAKNGRVYGLIGAMGCTNIKALETTKIDSLRKETNN